MVKTKVGLKKQVQTEKVVLTYVSVITDLDGLYEHFIYPIQIIRKKHGINVSGNLDDDRYLSLLWAGESSKLEDGLREWFSTNAYPADDPRSLYRIPDLIPLPEYNISRGDLESQIIYLTTPGGLTIVKRVLSSHNFTLVPHPNSQDHYWVPEKENIARRALG